MNDSLLRKFCESPHRKLIVIIVTVMLGLVVLIPMVDEYFDNKASYSTLTQELDNARRTAEALPELEAELAKVVEQLQAIESRTITNSNLSEFRSKVVDIVRASGCQVRRFDIGTPSRRPWLQDDDPIEPVIAKQPGKGKTPFVLEQRNVVLLVDGSMENLNELLAKLHEDESLAYLNRLQLKPAPRGGDQVTMEIDLWLFALDRRPV